MLRYFKSLFWLALVLAAARPAGAYTMWGPLESWQVPALNYGGTRFFNGINELGGPKVFGTGSRLNVPIITYAYDYTFLQYFGVDGVKAIDSAFAVFNGLPAASSANLSRFNTQGVEQVNYSAQAMGLIDLKSTMMGAIMEHMGLLGETHVFDLRARGVTPVTCVFDYDVINRNYDPVSYDPSDYVNGRLYSYVIQDLCPTPNVGDAVETLADTTQPSGTFTAVATKEAILIGGLYYTTISRDDMGGIRYLYQRNHLNNEVLDSEAVPGVISSGFQIVNPFASNSVSSNMPGIYGGVEKIQYVKVAFSSLLSTTFTPITYHYSMPFVTNGRLMTLPITRTVTQPDIIITAADLPATGNLYTRSVNFFSNSVTSVGGGLSGEVMAPEWVITFNTVGPLYENTQSLYLDQQTAEIYPVFTWGSYNGSGAAPIIYPVGSSVDALWQEVMNGASYVSPATWNPYSANATNVSTSTSVATP